MRTLYVTDMDGTLLNNGSFVSDESADIITDLSERGALITVATARTPATVVPLMQSTYTLLPYIVMTGAATFDPRDMTYHDLQTINADDADNALRLLSANGVSPFVYYFGDDGMLTVWHDRQMSEVEQEFYHSRTRLSLKRFTFIPEPSGREIALLFALGSTDRITAAAEAMAANDRYSISCYPDIFRHDISLLEIFAAGVSKASAIERMARHHRCDRIVTFGDNKNDLPMFAISDIAVAVANAHPVVREAADIIIGPNYDNSVAKFIAADFDNPKV